MHMFMFKPSEKRLRFYAHWYAILALSLVILRYIFYQHAMVPTGSLTPSVLPGDVVIMDRTAYGYSRYGIPFQWNLFEGRIRGKVPQRGDIIAFNSPVNPKIDYTKRCIGLPGDRIQFRHGKLLINGEACHYERIEDFSYFDDQRKTFVPVHQYLETFPNGHTHKIIRIKDDPFDLLHDVYHNTAEIVVPQDHVFAVGDNRSASYDSRFWGPVSMDRLYGKIIYNLMSFHFDWDGSLQNPLSWRVHVKPRWERFGIKTQ